MGKKRKWYVVWNGYNPGIYDNWADCKLQVDGFVNARYKGFSNVKEAQEAYRRGPQYQPRSTNINTKSTNGGHVYPSISVDAACSGNPGLLEYRGVDTNTGKVIFHKGPYQQGTNNIGEFLALVHGLALCKMLDKHKLSIYTDSKTAMSWVRKRKANTKLKPNSKNTELFDLIHRAENWLRDNSFSNSILKWDTKNWGEIPADFGRK